MKITSSIASSLFLIVFSFLFVEVQAQNLSQPNAAEILLQLKKLNTLGSVLYVAAHPDDENTRLIGFLAKEKKLRTAYLSLTRGDGGQNLIGKEQGDALGLIRTQELLEARRTDGAEQFFTRANDFGFSKNPEETFSIWNKDNILADVVWAIRKFKPDVIICRFPTTGEGGHGHHTASAILTQEAFDAAADAKRFPEQLKYVTVWQPKRLFWNTFNFGTTNTTASDQIKIDVGVFNPLLGKSYGEIAAESRSMHKSQGFGSAKSRGETMEYFKLLKGEPLKTSTDIFEALDFSWKRFKTSAKAKNIVEIEKLIETCIKKYNLEAPEASLNDLATIYKELQRLTEEDSYLLYWKNQKLKEVEGLMLACAGLFIEATATDFIGIADNITNLNVQVINRNVILNDKNIIKLNKINFLGQTDTLTNLSLKKNILFSFKHKEKISASAVFSNPYWLNDKHEAGIFVVKNPLLIGIAENEPTTQVFFEIEIQGLLLKITRNVVYKFTDPVKGEIYRPFEILPPATVNLVENVYVFNTPEAKNIQLIVKANASNIKGMAQIEVPAGWEIKIKNPEFSLQNKNDEAIIEATVQPKSGSKLENMEGKLKAFVRINENVYSKSIKRIDYDHIPSQFILTEAEAMLIGVNLKKAGNKIGYILGAGDDVPASLKQIGYDVAILTDELLVSENLSKYDAIVTGVRAYNTNERLQVHYNKLMQYVNNGGNLVVQYNTNSRIGPVLAKIAPFPFTISRERVTDQNAEIRVLKPKHSILNFPNVIESKDFENWIQERGVYFSTDLDKNFETIFSTNDLNEKPQEGSLVVAKYGKGNFVYTGLAFFRQLPAGVSGAYRLFVNLLSLPKN
jgi:LmbE family N-acetylglucosaminyl deacetylase